MEQKEKPSLEDQKIHLRWLHGHLYGHVLAEINRDLFDNVAQARKAEGVSNSTVNRTMEITRAILRRAAFDWQWIDSVPSIRMLPEPAKRVRWITREESERLLAELPEHLAAMAGFSLATGLRESNVTGLEWSQVDLVRRVAWIHGDQTKNKRSLHVPLNAEAVLVLRRQVGKHQKWVFTYKGNRVIKANTAAWRKTLIRAGIEKFRWHDLRHTWASWHVQAGTPLHVLKELGGWSSYDMVLRYAHLSAEHLADYAENLSAIRTVSGTPEKKSPNNA